MSFLNLWKDAAVVLTDSGGLQEETTALGVPCVTIRENTERPITVEEGSNVLAGTDPARIIAEVRKILRGEGKRGRRPHLWDGRAAQRIVEVLAAELEGGVHIKKNLETISLTALDCGMIYCPFAMMLLKQRCYEDVSSLRFLFLSLTE